MAQDENTICIVMYGGGTTSYENARRSIDKYGLDNTEIWFADTRVEDADLYRFNHDVENILGKTIRVFSKHSKDGKKMDIWDVFYSQKMLGNSRLDPCSKYLKRVPLRRALDEMFPFWKCSYCGTMVEALKQSIDVEDIDNLQKKKGVCLSCMDENGEYAEVVNLAIRCSTELSKVSKKLDQLTNEAVVSIRKQKLVKSNESLQSEIKGMVDDTKSSQAIMITERNQWKIKTLDAWQNIDDRMLRVNPKGQKVIVTLGMDNIEDCHRVNRARQYWIPYKVEFPLTEKPFVNKSKIKDHLAAIGIEIPRLYKEGFQHNNCGGFCVKAGMGQFAHLLKVNPRLYLSHEKKEQEFREFIGRDVSILRRMVNGEKINLTMKMLRERVEDGENFRFDVGEACSCVNPPAPE